VTVMRAHFGRFGKSRPCFCPIVNGAVSSEAG
jgi:hypothetical protein